MTLEIELKFPLPDATRVLTALQSELGARPQPTQHQVDTYYNHPARDFGQTDEAFRIRVVNGQAKLTYKGPKLSQAIKTRQEFELPVGQAGDGSQTAETLHHMLTALGFRRHQQVIKTREPFALDWQDREFEIAFDTVQNLGTFLEIEHVTTADHRTVAETAVLQLATQLDLTKPEPRSYLEMLPPA